MGRLLPASPLKRTVGFDDERLAAALSFAASCSHSRIGRIAPKWPHGNVVARHRRSCPWWHLSFPAKKPKNPPQKSKNAPGAGGGGGGGKERDGHRGTNAVDGDDVPVRHFGAICRCGNGSSSRRSSRRRPRRSSSSLNVRFKGEAGEQATMFLLDPCGNALEFKAFKDIGRLFAK